MIVTWNNLNVMGVEQILMVLSTRVPIGGKDISIWVFIR
jgi:hypothetical protein